MKTIELTDPEISYVYSLILEKQRSGEYSGNREQYYKGIESIINKLENAYNKDKS